MTRPSFQYVIPTLQTEHLKNLIRVLKNIPAHSFDLNTWLDSEQENDDYDSNIAVKQGRKGYKNWKEKDQESEKHPCGTVACAMGWICFDSYFNKRGLKMEPMMETPVFKQKYRGFDAAEKLFGFQSNNTALVLFSNASYPTEQAVTTDQVIARIEYLIEHGEYKLHQEYI